MEINAYLILAFTIVQLLVALINVLFREKPRPGKPDGPDPLVSVMIPARNEEKNIGNLLGDLIKQDYTNIEVIVFDDLSEDLTFNIAAGISQQDRRLRILGSQGLPDGWLGKNHACNSMAAEAKGEYFLFLDADVRIGNGVIRNTVTFARKEGIDLLSIFPRQMMEGPGEKSTVPLMNYILLSLLPLIAVRKLRFSSLAAANGQFMLYRAISYQQIKPHERLKHHKVEDIKSARLYKSLGYTVACLTGDDSIKCRMYSGYRKAITGFSKNVAMYFGNSLLVAALFWLVTTAGFIIILKVFNLVVFTLYLAAYLATRVLVSVASEQKPVTNLVFLIQQQLSFGIIIFEAIRNRYFRKFVWKGRHIT